jgi:hypothetical protein
MARGRLAIAAVAYWAAAVLLGVAGWTFMGALDFPGSAIPGGERALNPSPGCTSLALDRATWQTTAGPCPSGTPDTLTATLAAKLPHR